ncbi:MAG TPA: cupredoxin domain-containing protein [Anaeromyxobacter sp.]|nr:cupredoxin domain-containing protein [Anaeromyxobacter sp.]
MRFPRAHHLLPLLTLLALATPGLSPHADEPKVIEITAQRFQFAPGQLTLKKGEPVVLRLRSLDVTHGFYSKPLGIDATIEPGKANDVTVTPTATGKYVVICDHFCGSGHGNMKLTVEVVE